MIYQHVIEKVHKAFASVEKPESIVDKRYLDGDRECQMIQKDFGGLDREQLSDKMCSMLCIDAPLILNEALFYFLPVIAEKVLTEKVVLGDLLMYYLETFDLGALPLDQAEALSEFIESLKQMERELEAAEAAEELLWSSDQDLR